MKIYCFNCETTIRIPEVPSVAEKPKHFNCSSCKTSYSCNGGAWWLNITMYGK